MKIINTSLRIMTTLLKITVLISGINMIFSYIEELVHRKMPEGGRFYVWRHGKIFYHKRGAGAPVLVIHGFEPNHSGKDLESLSHHLATNHTVYRIDLLGFGLSDKPWFTYTNYLYVQLIHSFIRDVIGETSDIVACDGSGLCALQASQFDSAMIGKIVLVDPVFGEPMPYKGKLSDAICQIIDLPVIGTFLYNLYSLTGKAPFDKEGRHVFTSRLAGCLTSSLSGHENLITDRVAVMNRSAGSQNVFTFGDVNSSLI